MDDHTDIVTVRNSTKDLRAIQSQAHIQIKTLNIQSASGINLQSNSVELYVIDRSKLDKAILDHSIQMPAQVHIIAVNELSVQQESDIYGGLPLSQCTSGFAVVDSRGIRGVTTAAHCNNTISYNGINLPMQVSWYGGAYDIQWHTAPNLLVRNWVWDGSFLVPIKGIRARDHQVVGQYVCKYGASSHKTCGHILDINFDPDGSDVMTTSVRVHEDNTKLSLPGDSGGPWFSGNTGYGSHIGSFGDDAYYMAIDFIEDLGVTILTNSNLYSFIPTVKNDFYWEGKPYPSPIDAAVEGEYDPNQVSNPYPLP